MLVLNRMYLKIGQAPEMVNHLIWFKKQAHFTKAAEAAVNQSFFVTRNAPLTKKLGKKLGSASGYRLPHDRLGLRALF